MSVTFLDQSVRLLKKNRRQHSRCICYYCVCACSLFVLLDCWKLMCIVNMHFNCTLKEFSDDVGYVF